MTKELESGRADTQYLYSTEHHNSLPQDRAIGLPINSFYGMISTEKPLTPKVAHKKKSSLQCLTARTVSTSPNKVPVIVNRGSLTKSIGNTLLKSPMQSFNSFLKGEFSVAQIITPTKSRKFYCSCKKSYCIKLYCDCFASNSRCEGCQCVNCKNTEEHIQKTHTHTEQAKQPQMEVKLYPKVRSLNKE